MALEFLPIYRRRKNRQTGDLLLFNPAQAAAAVRADPVQAAKGSARRFFGTVPIESKRDNEDSENSMECHQWLKNLQSEIKWNSSPVDQP